MRLALMFGEGELALRHRHACARILHALCTQAKMSLNFFPLLLPICDLKSIGINYASTFCFTLLRLFPSAKYE